MKERTEIDQQSLHFTYMELASCRTYDDARDLLNELVTTEIGREYGDKYHFNEETDEYICDEVKYKNSVNPKVVKLAVIDAMTSFLNSRELLSEEGTIAYEKAKAKDTAIIQFKRMDNDMRKVRDWVQRWQKEAAPNMNNEIQRLKPKKETIEMIWPLFENLIRLDYFEETNSNKKVWAHLCGISNEIIAERIKWKGTNVEFAALMDNFFVSEFHKTYFDFEEDAPNMEYVVNHFLNKNGKAMNYTSVKSQKNLNNAKLEEIWEKMKKTI